jgi:hypothetical protein
MEAWVIMLRAAGVAVVVVLADMLAMAVLAVRVKTVAKAVRPELEAGLVAAGVAVYPAVHLLVGVLVVAFLFMVKALTVAAVQGITPLVVAAVVVLVVLMEARLLPAHLVAPAEFTVVVLGLAAHFTTLAFALNPAVLAGAAQFVLSGPVALEHSRQLA